MRIYCEFSSHARCTQSYTKITSHTLPIHSESYIYNTLIIYIHTPTQHIPIY